MTALKINDYSTENADIMPLHNKSQYTCKHCKKVYNERSGLWRHKKKCNFSEENTKTAEENITLTMEEKEESYEENNKNENMNILINCSKNN